MVDITDKVVASDKMDVKLNSFIDEFYKTFKDLNRIVNENSAKKLYEITKELISLSDLSETLHGFTKNAFDTIIKNSDFIILETGPFNVKKFKVNENKVEIIRLAIKKNELKDNDEQKWTKVVEDKAAEIDIDGPYIG